MDYGQFCKGLTQLGGLEVINDSASASQLRVTGRVRKDNMRRWLSVLGELIDAAATTEGVSLDVSKQYFKRDGQMRYAWRLIFQSEDLGAAYAQLLARVTTVMQGVRAPTGDTPYFDEGTPIPLNANPNRHAGKAGPIGSVATGPKAKKVV